MESNASTTSSVTRDWILESMQHVFTAQAGEADEGGYDANHAPFELVSHDEVEDVLEVLTNAGGRCGCCAHLHRRHAARVCPPPPPGADPVCLATLVWLM